MPFLDELGLKAAEQLENAVGPFVALASYRRLLAADLEIRIPAAFGALRCAVALADEKELREMTAVWAALPRPATLMRPIDVSPLVAELAQKGRADLATTLAAAEVLRNPTAQSRYVLARATEISADPDLELWAATIDAAVAEKHARLATRSVARWLELSLFSSDVPRLARPIREEIARRAASCAIDDAAPAEKLVILRARLLSAGRFARAAALSGLEELARQAPNAVSEQAVLACAHHIDVSGDQLDAVAVDRARAALSRWPRELERDRALARLTARVEMASQTRSEAPTSIGVDRIASLVERAAPETVTLVHRARVMARGGDGAGAVAPDEPSAAHRLASWGLDAVGALGREQENEAARALTRAAEAMPPLAVVPPVLWAAARAGLRSKNAGTRRAAATLVERALSRSASSPPSGFSVLASELESTGFGASAQLALREAVRTREAGAAHALGHVERGLAYAALQRGDRKRALDALREARALLKSGK